MLNADRIVPVFGWQSQRFYNFANMQKCEDMRKAFFFLMAVLCCVPALARKEYRTLKAQLKDANEGAVENPLNTVNQLIKNDKLKDDPELYHYGVMANLKINELYNRKAYLKQNYDTEKLFKSIYGLYDFSLLCDSMERKAAAAKGNDKVKYKYRSEHGALLRSQYVNLYNGGQFYLTKKNFAEAYKYFDMYILIRSNPIFDRPVKPKNSLQLIRAAYWATVCAWQTGERDKFLRYNRMALQDTVYRQKELELTARVAAAAKDTAAMVAALKSGVREYPMQDYFFTNLIDYYNGKGEFARALALSDSLLARDARSVMAQYGRSLVLLKMKRYDDCIAVAQSIVASDSTYAGAYYNIGAAYLAKASELEGRVTSDMPLQQLRSVKRSEDKLLRTALPFMERYRALKPDAVDWWGRPLYNIYLALNMGDKLEEVDKLITAAEQAKNNKDANQTKK